MKMNEYMCRAKRIDNNSWDYGYFMGSDYMLFLKHDIWTTYIIDPNTLCRYTGLKDKNDTQIFEHDYVRTQYGRICEVIWFSTCAHCGWDLMPVADLNFPPPTTYLMWASENIEVIGNKFDNTNLME